MMYFGHLLTAAQQQQLSSRMERAMLHAQQDYRAALFQKRYGAAFAGIDCNTGRPILWRPTTVPTVRRAGA